jgi:hypothetical protein
LLTLSLAVVAWPGRSTIAQVSLVTRVGFSDSVRFGHWSPVDVQVDNGEPARRGELYARVRRGSPGRDTEYVERIELPARSRRTAQFVLPLLGTDHPILIGMRDESGQVLAEQSVALDDYRVAENIVLVLSREVDLEFLPPLLRRKTAVAYPRPEELPTHWAGLDAIRAVIVHGVSLTELEQTRYDALREWVMGGGILIFAAGSSYSVLQGPRERELLPVVVQGLARVDKMPVLRNYASQAMPQGGWLIVDSEPGPGQALAEAEGHPIIASRTLGLGTVYFLAVDYALPRLTSWPGNFALWDQLLSLDRKVSYLDALAAELDVQGVNHPAAALLHEPLLRLPPRSALAAVLLAYGLLILALVRGTGARGLKAGFSWAGLGLAVAGATAASFLLREPFLDADAGVVSVKTQHVHPGFDSGRAVEYAGVYTSRGGVVDLSVGGGGTLLRLLAQHGATGGPLDIPLRIRSESAESRWDGLALPRYSAAVMTLESVAPSPVAIDLKRGLGVTALRIENRTALPVRHMAVVHRGVYHALGDLEPEAARVEDFFDTVLRPAETVDPVASVMEWNLPPRLGGLSLSVPLAMVQRRFGDLVLGDLRDTVVFIGWIVGDEPGVHVRHGRRAEFGLTLVTAEIRL